MADKWVLMQCLDAFKDAQGNPGVHKVPVPGYDPMSKAEARQALAAIEAERPDEDFSIRKLAEVVNLIPPTP